MSYAGMLHRQRDTVESAGNTSDVEQMRRQNSQGRLSEASSTHVRIVVDKIYLELNELDKCNARIKKQILKFNTLEKGERLEARELLQSNLKNSQSLQARISSITEETQRLKFQNLLSKKVKELEVLSQSLVYKEKEMLNKYRDQLEDVDLEENTSFYEKRSLLDSSSDEDDTMVASSNSKPYKRGGNQKSQSNGTAGGAMRLLKYDDTSYDNSNESDEDAQQYAIQLGGQTVQQEEEVKDSEINQHEEYLKQRGERVNKVQSSLQKIHKMYETLNEIVQEQGETLNKIEDNVVVTKHNTKNTVKELQKALVLQKTIRERLCGCDFGIMCLSIWFIVALLFFTIDLFL